MRQCVEDVWVQFTNKFEGHTDYFYLDQSEPEGLVTIGYGNLADPFSLVSSLLFLHPDGRIVTLDEKMNAWMAVKRSQSFKKLGGGNEYWKKLTDIRATEDSIIDLVFRKLRAMEAYIKVTTFKDFEAWPGEAQLGTLSMSWAMGEGSFLKKFPNFVAACQVQDWVTAANECHMDETNQNDSFRRRNLENKRLFLAAANGEAVIQVTRDTSKYIELPEPPMTKPHNDPEVV